MHFLSQIFDCIFSVKYCGLQSHCRSKVIGPNEWLYMSSYLGIIVIIALTGTILKILTLEI